MYSVLYALINHSSYSFSIYIHLVTDLYTSTSIFLLFYSKKVLCDIYFW